MNRFIKTLAIAVSSLLYVDAAVAQDVVFSKETFSYANVDLPYRKADIRGTGTGASLVVYLHGGSSKGNDNETQMGEPAVGEISSWLAAHGQKAIMLVPQCPKDKSWIGTMLRVVKALLQQYVDRGVADVGRIFILGGSMGGTGTWNMLSAYPGYFAAAMPVAGNPAGLDAGAVAQTPVFTVMGTDDAIMDMSNVESFLADMDKYGADFRYEVEQGWSHEDVCKRSYTDERLSWVFSHDRGQADGLETAHEEVECVESVNWYDLSGRALPGVPRRAGLYLKYSRMQNGVVKCEKVRF